MKTSKQYCNLRNLYSAIFSSLFLIASNTSVALTLSDQPLFLTQNQPPLVMLTMGRDHRFFYEAYNDASDLNGDGVLDYVYKPDQIDYFGYFDSLKCYTYDDTKFIPSSLTTKAAQKVCSGATEWSGDWLNYNTMTRMDTLRKVLYGGTRQTDTATATVLERTFVPQDSHGWAKKYESVAVDGYDIRDYTPLGLPNSGQRHLFGNVTLTSVNDAPLLRVVSNVIYQPWEWASIERPVLGDQCATGNNSRQACTTGGGGGASSWTTTSDSTNGISWVGFTRSTYDLTLQHAADPTPFPANHTEFDDLLTNWAVDNKTIATPYLLGSDRPNRDDKIECTSNCNPGNAPNNQQDDFLTILTGEFKTRNNNAATGNYRFFIDGDDAVDVQIVDNTGTTIGRVGYYGGHGFADSNPSSVCADGNTATSSCYVVVPLVKDTWYKFKIRHEERSGGEGYRLHWYRPDYSRWEVIDKGVGNVDARGLLWSTAAGSGSGDFYRSAYKLNTHFASGPNSGNFDANRHPINRTGMDFLETTYTAASSTVPIKFGSDTVTSINCNSSSATCNPHNAQQERYLTVITGSITVATEDDYKFAVDGDDAVEVMVDGALVSGKYGAGGFANNTNYAGVVHLTAGTHTIEFRHMESTGVDGYKLQWQKSGGGASMTNYNVRVEVCNSTIGLEDNCKSYISGATTTYKPTGLLHKYGEGNGMYFGLLSGSYIKNTSGGVLRRAIGSMDSEINTNGTYKNADGTYHLNGIISTIDRFRIDGFNYSPHAYDDYDSATVTDTCGWISTRPMKMGECQNWGSPLGEMLYEVTRYFAGKTSATSGFTYSSSESKYRDNQLGLPLATWSNPYGSGNFAYCSKPYVLLINDVYPSFDADSVPGSKFCTEEDKTSYPCSGGTTFSGDLSGLDIEAEGKRIWDHEFGAESKNVFIGQAGSSYDNAPSLKSASTLGNLRGLAPSAPTRQGSYSTAEVAYWAKRNDLNAAPGDQKLSTFSVALAAPLPEITIPIGTNNLTFIPFAKSVGGSSIDKNSDKFQPTNQIVDFYIETIKNTWKKTISGTEVKCSTANASELSSNANDCDSTVNNGRPYYKFRINYEDVEQGADHDMDAISLYEVFLNSNSTVTVKMSSDYAAGGILQHMGYVASGTVETDENGTPVSGSSTGIYLNVRDSDTDSGSDPDYFLDTPNIENIALPLTSTRYFKSDTSSTAAVVLKDPLWFAAKFGGFSDGNDNDLPDSTEWDADSDGVPDNYFLVVNPLKLQEQLGKALAKIQNDSGTAAALATNSQSFRSGLALYQARFSSDGWGGELNAYPILNQAGTLGDASWQAQYVLSAQTPASRIILTYDKDITTVDAAGRPLRGIPFKWDSMTTAGLLQTQLNKNMSGTTDSLGENRVSYLRGEIVSGMRSRPFIKGTDTPNLLGDIVNSAIQYVGPPAFGYSETSYGGYYTARKNRTSMVYTGANDGFLHGFDAASGKELLAYMPYTLFRNNRLSKLTSPDYGKTSNPHAYFVDGTVTVGDVCSGTCGAASDWKTILVGGLNRGGQGIYALDITNPSNFTEANADSIALWEFSDDMDNLTVASDAPFSFTDTVDTRYGLGYTYSRPAVVRICTQRDSTSTSIPKYCAPENRKWVVIFGSGYNNAEADGYASSSGHAVLYVLDALTGKVLTKLSTKTGDTSGGGGNGLATVAVDDADGDTVADYVYGGDIKGNMWKFDLSGALPTDWSVAYGTVATPAPLYISKDSGALQPITTSPEIASHPLGGTMVLFGTGKYLEATIDPASTTQQTFYGIRDQGSIVSSADRSNLQEQTIDNLDNTTSAGVLNAGSATLVDWSVKDGWYIDLPDAGERVAYDPRLYGDILYFPTLAPSTDACSYGGSSWDYFVDYLTGGALTLSPFAGVGKIDTSVIGETRIAVRRKSEVGISPTGTSVSTGSGQGIFFKGGSTGEIESFGTNLGTTQGRRVAWRELTAD